MTVIFIFGTSSSGKSHLIKELIHICPTLRVIDPDVIYDNLQAEYIYKNRNINITKSKYTHNSLKKEVYLEVKRQLNNNINGFIIIPDISYKYYKMIYNSGINIIKIMLQPNINTLISNSINRYKVGTDNRPPFAVLVPLSDLFNIKKINDIDACHPDYINYADIKRFTSQIYTYILYNYKSMNPTTKYKTPSSIIKTTQISKKLKVLDDGCNYVMTPKISIDYTIKNDEDRAIFIKIMSKYKYCPN